MIGQDSRIDSAIASVKALPAKTPMTGRARVRKNSGRAKFPPTATAMMAAAVSEPSIQGSGIPSGGEQGSAGEAGDEADRRAGRCAKIQWAAIRARYSRPAIMSCMFPKAFM